jgi:hypothetical protein
LELFKKLSIFLLPKPDDYTPAKIYGQSCPWGRVSHSFINGILNGELWPLPAGTKRACWGPIYIGNWFWYSIQCFFFLFCWVAIVATLLRQISTSLATVLYRNTLSQSWVEAVPLNKETGTSLSFSHSFHGKACITWERVHYTPLICPVTV